MRTAIHIFRARRFTITGARRYDGQHGACFARLLMISALWLDNAAIRELLVLSVVGGALCRCTRGTFLMIGPL